MVGLRTVGCCSHVASFVYYIGFGKYLPRIPQVGMKPNFFVNYESDETDNEQEQDFLTTASI
jgi:hypothetical protein